MNPQQRMTTIRERLQNTFSPTQLEIIDDQAQHRGHAAAESGAGYYTIKITADCFKGLSRVEVHRKIYQELTDLIPHEIHALQIKILPPVT